MQWNFIYLFFIVSLTGAHDERGHVYSENLAE